MPAFVNVLMLVGARRVCPRGVCGWPYTLETTDRLHGDRCDLARDSVAVQPAAFPAGPHQTCRTAIGHLEIGRATLKASEVNSSRYESRASRQ